MELNIVYDLKYKEFVKIVEALKAEYNRLLMSFSVLEYHEKVLFMAKCKRQIYALPYPEYLRDRIWLYMNGYLDVKAFQNNK